MIASLTARLKTCVSAEKGWDDGRCALDKEPMDDDEKLESWSSDRQVPERQEVVRDKGVTTEGKRVLGSPISVTDWASGLQCMVPSPSGCQDFRAGHSEVCELGLELSEAACRPCQLHLSRRMPGDCCFRAARRPCQGPQP